jgi:CheY-like chemotaxis protein
LERSAPTILLIEDDEFDRMTLTRMLEESGYSVMATHRGAPAVDTFAIYHRRIALVLASTGLSDVERIRLAEALYRIAPYVPVVMAARRASHRTNSGEDSGRHPLFVALIAEVRRRLHQNSTQAEAQAQSFAHVQPPAPTQGRGSRIRQFPRPANSGAAPAYQMDDRDEADEADETDETANPDETVDPNAVFFPDGAPFAWTGSSSRLTTIAYLDPRSYLRRLSNARRMRRRRLRRIGIAVVAGCCAPLIMLPLLEMRATNARAIAEEASIPLPPLASASISARMGIVPLVSSAHVRRSRLADDLAKATKTPAQPQPNRRSNTRSDRR